MKSQNYSLALVLLLPSLYLFDLQHHKRTLFITLHKLQENREYLLSTYVTLSYEDATIVIFGVFVNTKVLQSVLVLATLW